MGRNFFWEYFINMAGIPVLLFAVMFGTLYWDFDRHEKNES